MRHGQPLTPQPAGQLVLTTLGRASLACVPDDGPAVELLGPGKPLGLLVYLACAPGRTASREHLVDLLWADLDVDAARHSVRQAIWYLRQRLGDAAIGTGDGTVTLCAPLTADRAAFLDAMERVQLEHAIELYSGDFLPGFAAPGGADFEHWADLERARLKRLFLRAGETVVRDWMGRGRMRRAKALAARLRDAEPEDESGWRLVLETLLTASDRIGAELEAQRLEEALRVMDRPPEPATTALLALVRQAPPLAPTASAAPWLNAELVGREREFATILAAWDAARSGRGAHVHLVGGAGLGKTRLLSDIRARLRAIGNRVVYVRASPGERSLPYALAAEIAGAVATLPGAAAVSPGSAAALVALNPALSSRYNASPGRATDAETLRHREIALAELLNAVADEQPTALLIDDLHWTDTWSRRLLEGLLTRVEGRRLLAITAARTGLSGDPGVTATGRTLALDPLSSDDIGALLAGLARLPAEDWATELAANLHQATHGTPLMILETLHVLIERGILHRTDGAWTCTDREALASELAGGAALGRRIGELEREPRWLMVLLAAAGVPLDRSFLAHVAGRSRDAVQADLVALEVRGLTARDDDGWQAAHDEIAAQTLELANADAVRTANATLGAALAALGSDDPALLHRAGRHLAAAGRETELARVFARCLVLQHRTGAKRAARAIARDMLGEGGPPERTARLIRTLPLHVRLGLVTRGRVAATVASALVVAGTLTAIALRPAPPPPDAWLVVFRPVPAGSLAARRVALRRDRWERSSALDASRAMPGLHVVSDRQDIALRPDGAVAAYSRAVGDSGDIDVFLMDGAGVERRLTANPGDDRQPSWSPDGRRLAILTSRWSPNRYDDIEIIDAAGGAVQRITFDSGAGAPKWGPDGTRIAFMHQNRASHDAESAGRDLCWITPDGAHGECVRPRNVTLHELIGWYDARQVLVLVDSSGPAVARLDLDTHELRVVAHDISGAVAASPDGHWLACRCDLPGTLSPAWYVFPVDRPDLPRRLEIGVDRGDLLLTWFTPMFTTPRYVNRLTIVASSDTVPIRAPFRLRALGSDQDGDPIATPLVTWHALDSAVALVDRRTGELLPRHVGNVRIEASAGGWRVAERTLAVGASRYGMRLREDWQEGMGEGWIPFGTPLPALITGPDGRAAFWNQGDGWDESGAYTSTNYTATRGVGVEAWWSSPVDGPRQQYLSLSLTPWADTTRVAAWDHRTGSSPLPGGGCDVRIPPGDGRPRTPLASVAIGAGSPLVRLPDWVFSGRWYRIRVQVLPDGRCAYAVNGQPIALGASSLPLTAPYRVVLHGNSLGNQMLVGPVEIWEGVRDDIDWRLAPQP